MAERHIVALGGGGFSDDDPSLEDFILGLAASPRPKVCFVPTASGDSSDYIVRFYAALTSRDCAPSHLELFGAPERAGVRERLLSQDVVYVGGGNTANMLAVWRLHGLDTVFREAWEAGVVLCGTSAGANCWFEACTTDSFGPIAPLRDGLGLLPGSFCPHYDAEPERRPSYRRFIADGFPGGFAAENGVGLHFAGTELRATVSAADEGRAFHVERGSDGEVIETPLEVRALR